MPVGRPPVEAGQRVDRLRRAVAELEGRWFTTLEVSQMSGRTPDAVIKTGQRHPHLRAEMQTDYNGRPAFLYSEQRAQALLEYFDTTAQLGASLWDPVEKRDRRRRSQLVRYYRRRAERLEAAGNEHAAGEARAKARSLRDGLDRQLEQRLAEP
jgi:hypothetical protein